VGLQRQVPTDVQREFSKSVLLPKLIEALESDGKAEKGAEVSPDG
jgi:hypothetical protein